MTDRRKIFIVIGAILLMGSAIFAFVMFLTSGLVETTDEFFALVKDGKLEQAYESTATEFKKKTNFEEFKLVLTKTTLDKYESAFWSKREIINNEGYLDGTVTNSLGGTLPLHVDLIKENGEWKVYGLDLKAAGLSLLDTAPPLPSDEESMTLAKNTMTSFIDGMLAKSFASFYETISQTWKGQTSPEKLDQSFKVFIDTDVDFSWVKTVEPVLPVKPSLDENHILTVQGVFPGEQMGMGFQFRYVNENKAWQLLGLSVDVKPIADFDL